MIPQHRSQGALAAALLGLGLLMPACSSGGHASMDQWRQGVNRFVESEANGDLNALRDTWEVDGHRVFTVLGGDDPTTSTDVYGALLGHRSILGRPTFVYLVAKSGQGHVTDIRLATVSRDGKRLVWNMSQENEEALNSYLGHRSKSPPPARTAPAAPWPHARDRFVLHVEGGLVRVIERTTNAQWELALRTTDSPAS